MSFEQTRLALSVLRNGRLATGLPLSLLEEAEEVHQRARRWTSDPAIVGIGVGMQRGSTVDTEAFAINVLLDRVRCTKLCWLPDSVEVPGACGAIPVRVDLASKLRLQNGALSPLVGGDSVGRADGTGGTFACLVRWAKDPAGLYLLSNAHVLAFAGITAPAVGDEIITPSIDKGGRPGQNRVASLANWTCFDSGLDLPNVADAAIARIDPGSVSSAIAKVGVPTGINTNLHVGMQVRMGTPAGISTGSIQCLDFGLNMPYAQPGAASRNFGFSGQVLCSPFTIPGDSGAAILDDGLSVVGLHVAGSEDNSLFTPIKSVFDTLELSLVTDVPPGNANMAAVADQQLPLGFKPAVGAYYKAVDTLARTLWGEARGEGESGLVAVAAVVANRVHEQRTDQWGSTVEDVCLKSNQFDCWNPGAYRNEVEAVGPQDPSFQLCLTISRNTLAGQITDPTNGANSYFNPKYASPDWGMRPGIVIGNQKFVRV
jgi:hypothetical protein